MATRAKSPARGKTAIVTAMVLAAGLGTRMRPLTDALPKALVPLAGRPLIDHALDRLAEAGVTRAVVNVHHHADKLETHLSTRKRPAISISNERAVLLDTGGGVLKALPLLGDGPFIVHNSDSVWVEGMGSNLARLIEAFDAGRMDGLLLLAPVISSLGYSGHGDFSLSPEGRVARRTERGIVPFVFAGVSVATSALFDGAPAGAFSLNLPWNRAIEHGRLYGIRAEGIWMHVGTPEAVANAERCLTTGKWD
jgi:MurNAc alpha-1-phosphate uridylyltransferase